MTYEMAESIKKKIKEVINKSIERGQFSSLYFDSYFKEIVDELNKWFDTDMVY